MTSSPESPAPLTSLADVQPENDPRFTGLPKTVLTLWRISTAIGLFFGLLVIFAIELFFRSEILEKAIGFTGLFTVVLFALLIPYSFWLTRRKWENWRYLVRENDVIVYSGVLTRTLRCVPRIRIQHVDIVAGPFDRMFGLAHLTLHTAGTMQEVLRLPGLKPDAAERLREQLLIKVVPETAS